MASIVDLWNSNKDVFSGKSILQISSVLVYNEL